MAHSDVIDRTRAIIFLGTPHRGSRVASWGWYWCQFLRPIGSNPLLPGELTYDSPDLLDLHKDFTNSVNERLEVVNFFESRKSRLFKVWFMSAEAICVKEESATYQAPRTDNIALAVDHYNLNKFQAKDDEHYKFISGTLLRLINPPASWQRGRVYSIPRRTVENFIPRDNLSSTMAALLKIRHEKADVPFALAIHGLGGIGKTQLALRYAEHYERDYNAILWIDATNQETVKSSFYRCAHALSLKVNESASDDCKLYDLPTVIAVHDWLKEQDEEDGKWLVIVDNADDFLWGIRKLLPKGSQGSLIITSRNSLAPRLVRGGCEEMQISRMSEEEARALILQQIQCERNPPPKHIIAMADELACRLDYLPLALGLAVMTIESDADKEYGLKRYLEDYNIRMDELLQSEKFYGLSDENKTVWTVWDTTIQKLEEWYPDLQLGLFLSLLARFEQPVVHDEVFRLATLEIHRYQHRVYGGTSADVELPMWLCYVLLPKENLKEWDSHFFMRAQEILVRHNLILRTEERGWPGVTMHHLVKWRAEKYNPNPLAVRWHFLVIMAACQQYYSEGQKSKFVTQLCNHLPELDDQYLKELEVHETRLDTVFGTAATIYLDVGMLAHVRELWARASEAAVKHGKENDPKIQDRMAYLSWAYRTWARWDDAIKLGKAAVTGMLELRGPTDQATLFTMHDLLARPYRECGRWKEAEDVVRGIIERRTQTMGPRHHDTLQDISELALLKMEEGMSTEAERLFDQIIKIAYEDEEWGHFLMFLERKAQMYDMRGDWETALELQTTVFNGKVAIEGGKDTDETATKDLDVEELFHLRSKFRYGLLSLKVSTLQEDKGLRTKYYRQGRDVFSKLDVEMSKTKPRHKKWYEVIGYWAFTMMLKPRINKSEQLLKGALHVLKVNHGESDPKVLNLMTCMGWALFRHERFDEAEVYYQQVYETYRDRVGCDHPATIRAKAKLATMWKYQGHEEKAQAAFIEGFETCRRTLGDDNLHTWEARRVMEDGETDPMPLL
jgi:tetratricopeptide (TPR) repeat protein